MRNGIPRVRYLRHNRLLGLDRGRLELLSSWLSARSSTLVATATGKVFTATGAQVNLTATAHGWTEGDGPVRATNAGGALPGVIAVDTDYWLHVVDANTLNIATSRRNLADEVYVTPSTAGTGTHTLTRRATTSDLIVLLRSGMKAETLDAVADIDAA